MPEYLAPGVFVEEVSFRAKSIEGVPTSTTGFAGMTAYGPVPYPGGPATTEPLLVTSFPEFERAYGKLQLLQADRQPYLAHAARAFFLNGGQRLYVSRVFTPVSHNDAGVASAAVPTGGATTTTWWARWPGQAGNVRVEVRPVRSQNMAVPAPAGHPALLRAKRAHNGALVERWAKEGVETLPLPTAPLDTGRLRVVREDLLGRQTFEVPGGGIDTFLATDRLLLVELQVTVIIDTERTDTAVMLGTDPAHRRYVGTILQRDDPEDDQFTVWLDHGAVVADASTLASALTGGGVSPAVGVFELTGGNDGSLPGADDLHGHGADPDDATIRATGLSALADVDDIAIVAMPDVATLQSDERIAATSYLIAHAEAQGAYRIAIVDGPRNASINQIRAFRGNFDSSYAALYYPWIEILDPNMRPEQGAPPAKLLLPPSGFVAGIYARTDIQRGVWKAPANEVVQGLTRFEANVNTGRQQVLNPEGINALRFFRDRGNRVWGARTLTSDPEWKYVPVRRFFIFLEHSIDNATQWAVFEPNGDALWRKVTRTVETFLEAQWRDGALLGTTPSQAYFVRCDRTTMTQNDLDNGRLICLVGVAPVRPAEFVVFRIGQWTADAQL